MIRAPFIFLFTTLLFQFGCHQHPEVLTMVEVLSTGPWQGRCYLTHPKGDDPAYRPSEWERYARSSAGQDWFNWDASGQTVRNRSDAYLHGLTTIPAVEHVVDVRGVWSKNAKNTQGMSFSIQDKEDIELVKLSTQDGKKISLRAFTGGVASERLGRVAVYKANREAAVIINLDPQILMSHFQTSRPNEIFSQLKIADGDELLERLNSYSDFQSTSTAGSVYLHLYELTHFTDHSTHRPHQGGKSALKSTQAFRLSDYPNQVALRSLPESQRPDDAALFRETGKTDFRNAVLSRFQTERLLATTQVSLYREKRGGYDSDWELMISHTSPKARDFQSTRVMRFDRESFVCRLLLRKD